jgi:hypothetical protein
MDELIKRIAEKTGLPEDKAKMAAETAIGFLKEKLPAPIASQLDSVVGGNSGSSSSESESIVDKAKDMIGGMFGS